MILEWKSRTPRFTATCERCKHDEPLTVETFEAARTLLASKGWLEGVRKGGPKKAHWLCPACLPRRSRDL